MPRLVRPSIKQRKWARDWVKHGNADKAAFDNYDVKNMVNAGKIAYVNSKNPMVLDYVKKLLDEQGVTDSKLAKGLNKIIDAGTSLKSLKTTTPTQALEAIKFASKLKDIIPAEKKLVDQRTATVKYNLENKSEEQLQDTLSNLIEEIKTFKKMAQKTSEI